MTESIYLCLQIARRNWLVYRKDLIANTSPTLADPALYLLSLGLGLGSFVTSIQGHSYIEFIAPGMCITTALFTSFFESSYGFYVRMTYENIYKAMLTTPIGVKEIVIGEFIWVGLKGAVMVTGVSIVLLLFGLLKTPALIFLMPIIGLAVAIPCGAMGLFSSAKVRNINQFQTVYSFLIAPLFFFSGIFFPLQQAPVLVKYIAYLFPVAPGVALAQATIWNENLGTTFAYFLPLLVFQSIVFCTLAYRKILPKLTF